jgi:preprotein translocase subunit SecY
VLRLSLIATSLANIVAGLGLGVMWYRYRDDEGMPIIVLFVALSLLIQGAFTLGHINELWKRWGIPSFQLFVTGEVAAALVGGVSILQGVLYNLHPVNGDYEFGPLLAATFMTTQAAIGLVYAARSDGFRVRRNA